MPVSAPVVSFLRLDTTTLSGATSVLPFSICTETAPRSEAVFATSDRSSVSATFRKRKIPNPAPPILYELQYYKEWHKRRLDAKPGLTGLWQVSGRSQVPFNEMVLLDLYYIDHWSLKLDLEILLRTIPVIIFGKGAY